MLFVEQFPHALALIGAMAADIHEMHTVREHIADLPDYAQEPVTREVLDAFGYVGSGFEDPDAYLDQLHTAMGYHHLDMVRDLQRWLVVVDPRLHDPDFEVNLYGAGYAREVREPS